MREDETLTSIYPCIISDHIYTILTYLKQTKVILSLTTNASRPDGSHIIFIVKISFMFKLKTIYRHAYRQSCVLIVFCTKWRGEGEKRSECFFIYINLDHFCFHPLKYRTMKKTHFNSTYQRNKQYTK